MEKEKIAHFKTVLEKLVVELRSNIEDSKDKTAIVSLDDPIGRISRVDAMQSQQMALALVARQRERLMLVEKALEFIAQGTYGQCGYCKSAIAEARLEAYPEIETCIQCSSRGH